ncbi:hypothetical protein GAG94_03150 [Lysinibacillus sphaericus]|uniref:hypothetical protein n=1 Tax=Lysinibacillus sphaericus TaxID=1421 RepID=UPI0013B0841D|nr:hypothetical protein [Lysinibacillus sphaericus]MBG9689407.1 hypothetical protein [Lysinibacillus sphaericus]QIC46207.1 hypothetical protein GAG94_03150 [Lysinibacillus sphaericus]
MQNVIFDVMDETVMKVAKQVKNSKSDSMLLLAPMSGNCSLHAPSKTGKYKGYHRIKMEVWIPEDAIKGENVLDDFSLITLLRLPKSRVQPHLIRSEGE